MLCALLKHIFVYLALCYLCSWNECRCNVIYLVMFLFVEYSVMSILVLISRGLYECRCGVIILLLCAILMSVRLCSHTCGVRVTYCYTGTLK
jgi:hypothetical protein